MKAIHAKRIFTGSHFIEDGVIIWTGKHIVAVGKKDILDNYNIKEIINTPHTIIPGFVDIQVNGSGGADFYGEGISEDTIKLMGETLAKFGCTSFCPTLVTSNDEGINKALDTVNGMKNLDYIGVLGIHIEGPMISHEHKGAHDPSLIRVISETLLEKICNSRVSIVSLAPETVPKDYILKLTKNGVKVSIAHTNATIDDIREAELYGLTLATHLYNGMSRFNSREPNAVGAILTSKVIYSSIIPDGNHSHFESVKLAHSILGERLITVTDGVIAMGTNMKKFNIGFQEVHIDENNRCVGDYGGLAGSMITPIECLYNLVKYCDFSFSEAVSSYTSIPAKALGVEKSVGNLVPESFADFSLIDESSLELFQVIKKGNFIDL